MTDAPVNKGILTDKEGAGFPGCRILVDGQEKDQPFTVLDFVRKYLDPIPKKARVCFQTKDGKISKIWPEPVAPSEAQKVIDAENAAGDARKAANDAYVKELAGAPKNPVEATTKIVQGQIIAIDQGTHTIEVKDKVGVRHPMMWAGPLNDSMARLKQWFFVSISAEKSGEYWRVIDQTYFKRPEDWPVHGGGSGGWKGQPRNERIIVLQSTLKVCAEVWTHTHMKIDDLDFERGMDEIVARAIKDTDTLMKAGGS
ncbi:MAG: hypothetical protein WC455_26185 [Dehalococcoidia bacterium]|jgi:hypothetical protein